GPIMTHSSHEALNESQITKSLRRFLDGQSDATVLVTRDYQILYANAEARVRFPRANVMRERSFEKCLAIEFPGTVWADLKPTFDAMLAAEDAEPAVMVLTREGRQIQMRVTVLDFDADCHCGQLESVLAVTFFDPDTDALMRR